MAKKTQRNVRRQPTAGRQAMLSQYNSRAWYDLPDWARQFVVDNIIWAVAFFVVILTYGALIAIVLGFHALPLEFIGVSASDNSAGIATLLLLLKFTFLVISLRPLYRHQRAGWVYLLIAGSIHFIHSITLHHAVTGGALLFLIIYLYSQVRRRYPE
jgi:hypothetical protein